MTSWTTNKEIYMKKFIVLLLLLSVSIGLCACSLTDENGNDTIAGTLVEEGINLLSEVLKAVVLITFTWLASVVGKSAKFKNTEAAIRILGEVTRQTVGELKQVFVDDWKAEQGGKLTPEQISTLREELLRLVHAKMDTATKDFIIAAGADLEALIIGEAESYLPDLKWGETNDPVIDPEAGKTPDMTP